MTVLRTVAVGFDGSPDAEAALRWSVAVANRVGADVVVVHATGLLEHLDRPAAAGDLEAGVRALAAEEGLDPGRLRWQAGDGDPCSVLLRAADPPISADLLVVGSRGQGAHAGLTLGSTSHELAEHASIPLVIVPSGRPAG
ncbi:MAG TPA: universal stress protein [Acidimicrobiales bacterium]|nr:universal stress protein [Acidimicrobiales bacterium]